KMTHCLLFWGDPPTLFLLMACFGQFVADLSLGVPVKPGPLPFSAEPSNVQRRSPASVAALDDRAFPLRPAALLLFSCVFHALSPLSFLILNFARRSRCARRAGTLFSLHAGQKFRCLAFGARSLG